jgi:protein-S-isoprenylcysteine O-methyltransferase Ste14
MIEHWISYAWLALLVVWLVATVGTKQTVQRQRGPSRVLHVGIMFLGIALIFNLYHWFDGGWLANRIIPREGVYVLGGAVITIAGMLFTVWARVVLGTNWSGTVTIKENHELIRRGPYQIVRHPIYTGLLLGLLGTAFVYGAARGLVGVLVCGLALWIKSQAEEQFMVQQFGEQYVQYRREVRALIPYVL